MATVDELINNATAQANDLASSASSLLNSANSYASGRFSLNWQDLRFGQSSSVPDYNDANLPTFSDFYNKPTKDVTKPIFLDLVIPDKPEYPDVPVLDTDGLFQQNVPDYDISPFSKDAPDVDAQSLSDELSLIPKPNIREYDAPEVTDVSIRDTPEVTLPTFNAHFNRVDVGTPENLQEHYEAEYGSVLPVMRDFVESNVNTWVNKYAPEYHTGLQRLEEKIASDIESGQALSDEFETALYNRARSRVEAERKRTQEELTRGVSKRGFELHPSVLSAGRQNLHQSAADNIAQQATELAIERAKLEIQHVQFVMSLSQSTRQMLLNASLQYAQILVSINGQALEYSKEFAEFISKTFNLMLEKARLEIDYYRIEADVYETELKSALSQLESIKLEIDVARLKKEIEQIDVDIFTKRIESENTKIKQYLALLQGVAEKAGIEKLKIELFSEEIKAYIALIQGKEAEYGVYTAALQGDGEKLKGEISKVDVYSKQIDAETSKTGLDIKILEAGNSYNRNLTDVFSSELDGYRTDVSAESSRFGSSIDGYKAALSGFIDGNTIKLNTFKTQYDKSRLDLSAAEVQYKGNIQIAIENANNFYKSVAAKSETATQTGRVFGTMAGNALNANNSVITKVLSE